jgi:hypothetical protein
VVVGKLLKPRHGCEDAIDVFQRGSTAFVAPGEQPAVQVQLVDSHLIQSTADAAHGAEVELIVALIRRLVNHIEVPT